MIIDKDFNVIFEKNETKATNNYETLVLCANRKDGLFHVQDLNKCESKVFHRNFVGRID